MPQVSVIVLTYNADPAKLRATLCAAAAQKDVDVQIVITDDGSVSKDFGFLPEFFARYGFSDWKLVENPENRGIVQNCYAGISAATGEYVFLTSPGDCLFDPYVLRDFYRFAKDTGAQTAFGNAVFYTAADGNLRTTRTYGTPADPTLYDRHGSLKQAKTAFFGGCWVIGASYFRRRASMLAWLEQIADTSKYMEDTPTTALALMEGHKIFYYDRNTVWYEDGTGVSTGANEKWRKLLHQDALLSFRMLKQRYPKDPYVDFAYHNLAQDHRIKRIAYRLMAHPVLSVRIGQIRKRSKKPIVCTDENLQYLTALLKTK